MSTAAAFEDLGDEGTPPPGWLSFDDDQVLFARDLIVRAGIVARCQEWRAAEQARLERHPGGAPESFPVESLLVAIALAAIHGLPLLATTLCDIMFRGISPRMRAELGIPDPPSRDDHRGWKARHRTVLRRFSAFLEPMDPSLLPKNRRLSPEEFDARVERRRADQRLSDSILTERSDRLTWVANRIIEASHSTIPRELRRQWKGSVALDATPVPAFSRQDRRVRGSGKRENWRVITHAADPDAALYVRSETLQPTTAGRGRNPQARKSVWAYEATLVVTASDDPPNEVAFPTLIVGMSKLHRPSKDIGANAITALASIRERDHPAGWLAADRAYSNTKPENFQLPARALGYDLVLDYREDQLGIQGSYAGALLIEGAWYSPGIRQELIDATIDHRAGRIDEGTYRARIEARRAFRMRPKGAPDEEGHVRYLCPASDGAPTARCDLKQNSVNPKTAGLTRVIVTDALSTHPPPVCAQQSVTIPPEAGAKLFQKPHYGSPEWHARYSTLRNANEGVHGVLKDGAHSALDDPERRRIRGVAAQTIFTAFIAMAANLRAITSFLRHARPDPDGTLRRYRKRRRQTDSLQKWHPETAQRSGAPPP